MSREFIMPEISKGILSVCIGILLVHIIVIIKIEIELFDKLELTNNSTNTMVDFVHSRNKELYT